MAESSVGQGGVQVVPGSTQGVFPQWFGMYYATVSSNADPLGLGRCQLRIPQVLGTEVSTWAWALTVPTATGGTAGSTTTTMATATAAITPPPVGTVVAVMFLGGDLANPAYLLLTTSVTTVTTPVTTGTGTTVGGAAPGTTGGASAGSGGTPAITTGSLPSGTAGTGYSQALSASGGTAPYTWSVSSGSLPSWATLNSAAGVISGTPVASGTSTFTVEVTDASGVVATQALAITVGSGAALLPVGSPPGSWTLAFADDFDIPYTTKYGTGPNPRVWSDHFLGGDMGRVNNLSEQQWYPHGYYGHSVANSVWTSTAQYQNPRTIDPLCPSPLQPGGQPGTFTAAMASGHLGISFTYGFIEARIQQPSPGSSWAAFWMLTKGDVWPPEIDIEEWQPPGHSGQDQLGYYNMASTWQSYYQGGDTNWHVWGCLLTSSQVIYYVDGKQVTSHSYDGTAIPWYPILNYAIQGAGGGSGYPANYNVDYVRVWVPTGVPAQPTITSISPSTGIASGGNIIVNFNTVAGATSYRVYASPTDSVADNFPNNSNVQYSATGSSSPLTVTGLPSGVRFNFTCCAINGVGYSIESLPVGPQEIALGITTASLPAGTISSAYSQTLAASGGTSPYTWSVSAGALPSWAALNTSTGVISGTPTTATGTTSFTVKVTDAAGNASTAVLSVTVAPAGTTGPVGPATGPSGSGPWTLAASEPFTSNNLSTNFLVYNNGQATSYSANSWMASQVSIDTTLHAIKSLAALSGGAGSPRVGGAWYWTGTANAAIREYGAWEVDFYTQGQAGYAPVLLMWPIPDTGNWPVYGEIDIIEQYATLSTNFSSSQTNLHLDTTAGSSRALHFTLPSTINWTTQHTARLEWMPSYISVFVDGTQVATTTDTSYIPHSVPMRLTMQQEFYGVSDGSISSLSAYTIVTGLRAYSSTSSIA